MFFSFKAGNLRLEFLYSSQQMPGTLATHLAVQEFPCIFCFLGVAINRFRAGHPASRACHGLSSFGGVGDVDLFAPAGWTGRHLPIHPAHNGVDDAADSQHAECDACFPQICDDYAFRHFSPVHTLLLHRRHCNGNGDHEGTEQKQLRQPVGAASTHHSLSNLLEQSAKRRKEDPKLQT